MKRLKLLALLAVFALFAAACGGSDGDSSDNATDTDDNTEVDASDDGDEEAAPADDEEEAAPADDDEEAAPAEEEAIAESTAGQGGELLLLQWQAPSQANVLLSGGTKDALAASLVLEPLAKFGPDGVMVPALAEFIPTAGNGISDDLTQITWTLKDILWSDGTPFTADDVVFTYEYCSDEATGCSLDLTTVASVVAVDDRNVMITFNEPKPFPYDQFVGYLNPVIQR
ncbi:MAG: ABC transporter substrate-binding protein, partial [Acidimicrobiales bacterium]